MSPEPSATQPFHSDLETPSVIRQVEGHLILGPIVRRDIRLSTLVMVGFICLTIFHLIRGETSELFNDVLGVNVALLARKMSALTQATILWYALKGTGIIAGFLLSTVGAMSTLMWHGTPTDASVVLIAGLAIIPGLEFIPRLIPHQKWITLGRIAVLLGCLGYALPGLLAE